MKLLTLAKIFLNMLYIVMVSVVFILKFHVKWFIIKKYWVLKFKKTLQRKGVPSEYVDIMAKAYEHELNSTISLISLRTIMFHKS